MADTVRLVDYFYIHVSDKPGEGLKVVNHLRDSGVHLMAFHGFPAGRRAQVDFVPSDPAALKAAARKAKWKLVGPKKAFFVQGDDRTGALVDHFDALAKAGVNLTAVDAVTAGNYYGAIIWVKPRDVKKAAKALGAG